MGVCVKGEVPYDIPVHQLKDGQIAVMTKWDHGYDGSVVQRYGRDRLIKLGGRAGDGWSSNDFWAGRDDLRVRVLPPGSTLEIK